MRGAGQDAGDLVPAAERPTALLYLALVLVDLLERTIRADTPQGHAGVPVPHRARLIVAEHIGALGQLRALTGAEPIADERIAVDLGGVYGCQVLPPRLLADVQRAGDHYDGHRLSLLSGRPSGGWW